jgi:hypothetical protein
MLVSPGLGFKIRHGVRFLNAAHARNNAAPVCNGFRQCGFSRAAVAD